MPTPITTITQSIAGAVAFGATITAITGGSYDLKGFFDASPTPTPPVLLTVADLGEQAGWQTLAFNGRASQLDFYIEQYLLFKRVEDGGDFTYIMPSMITILDAYLDALAANPFMTISSVASTHSAPKATWKTVRTKWGEVDYHSFVFRLQMGINK